MLLTIVLLACVLLMVGLLIAKRTGSASAVWFTKPLTSIGFVIVAFLLSRDWEAFQSLMLLGFVLCFIGDVLLIPESRTMFLCGLVAFLLGHLMYIAAFSQLLDLQWNLLLPVLLVSVTNLGIYFWLHRYIDKMVIPIVAYMLVISCMVLAACGVYTTDALPAPGRLLVLTGAIGFYLSDLFVVREQFVHKSFVNPLLGLPLYYVSQFALAFSLRYL